MKRLDRRNFMLMSSLGTVGAVLTACGNSPEDVELDPTLIADVPDAPPTLPPGGSPAADGGDSGGGEEGGGESNAVTLEAQDPYNWSVTELEAAPGQTIAITNTGFTNHDFVVDEWSVLVDLPAGGSGEAVVPEDAAVGDSFTFYCSIPGHRENGMEGTLTIVEATAPAAEEGGEEGEGEAPPAEGGAGAPITLEATDPYNWSVTEIEAAPGQTIAITNTGFTNHDFVIDEFSIMVDLPAGGSGEAVIPADAAVGDTYTFYCSIPGHRENGMEGALTIAEAAAGAPAGGEGEEEAPAAESTPAEEAAAESTPDATEETAVTSSPVAEASPAVTDGPINLVATDPYGWSVRDITATPGQVIHVINAGVTDHDFTIDELGIAEKLAPSAEVDVTLPDNATPGTYEYYCSIAGHRDGGQYGTLTIVAAAGGTPVASASPAASPQAAAAGGLTLEAQDPFVWSSTELEATPGQVITITNTGFLEHDFTVDDLGINVLLPSTVTADATIPADAAPGAYEFYCSIAGHKEGGMVGTLTIVAG